jgi:hypothetical protein
LRPDYRLCETAVLRLCTQQKFDSGQPGADCLTPQLHTNGHLATDNERNLLKSIAAPHGMPSAATREDSTWRQKVILRTNGGGVIHCGGIDGSQRRPR